MSFVQRFRAMTAGLEGAIDDALEHEVAEAVKDIMEEQLRDVVYSYDAGAMAMGSRRYEHGGLLDRGNMSAHVEGGHELVVENLAPDQGTQYDDALSDVVELGLPNYKQPYPRPFIQGTEAEAVSSGRAAAALRDGLRRQGYGTGGGASLEIN